ncbi:restriction endonuclease subunit S [Enterococcus faecalis]|uniref:restriction endonuclease subunit S n=1 Tax=Enterococcus faecalis TaxID=1351 RepID=UPI000353206C|nr:restriction endonuclease subunit S [Enterococcus faecalis]EHQ2709019.1 restriction endonuclease subunit S [Enterococcus faecalis]EKZ0131151.1 restriction endonuclease subunit S [Enterococcus faecalis]EPI04910.1 type I restriction modification DNA specificity domain protein [Enterococcus faecalis 20.SD.W.06]
MYFQNPDKVQSNNIDTRTYVMRTGDIAFEGHPNKEFKFGRFVANDIGTGVVSELFPIYRHKQEYDNYYWKNAIQIERVMGPIFAKSITSSGNSSNKLDPNHFLRQQVFIPKLEEQKKIGLFLKKLDDTITLHQRKLDQLKELKKAYLQLMFPKKDEPVPRIRFADFEEEWELCKLGEIFKERSDRSGEGELISVTINSGIIKASELERKDNSSTDKSNYKVVKQGDIAYNSMRMWQGASGFSPFNGILSPAYTVISPKENIDGIFMAYMFKKHDMIQVFKRNSQGLTSDTWNLKFPTLSTIKIKMPLIEEQKKIAKLLLLLDKTIAIKQNKLNQLKALKKAYLQNMFI